MRNQYICEYVYLLQVMYVYVYVIYRIKEEGMRMAKVKIRLHETFVYTERKRQQTEKLLRFYLVSFTEIKFCNGNSRLDSVQWLSTCVWRSRARLNMH